MIETSSLIGKIDTDYKFPKISDEERAKLKKTAGQPKAAPAAVEAPAETAPKAEEAAEQPTAENVENNDQEQGE